MPSDAMRQLDPRGLISEAFAIDGITEPDCRSIFFDWALGLGDDLDQATAIDALLAHYANAPEDHPMRQVLLEGVGRRPGADGPSEHPRRRGGRRGRNSEA
ncbi:MAG: hypothetical protein KTR21_05225 [Rhodobacteraceae bacterium]|nr:hypothetical protein [Paracoccaceae bacterium]